MGERESDHNKKKRKREEEKEERERNPLHDGNFRRDREREWCTAMENSIVREREKEKRWKERERGKRERGENFSSRHKFLT